MKKKRYSPRQRQQRNLPKSPISIPSKVSQQHERVNEPKTEAQKQANGVGGPFSMDNTTTVIITVIVLFLSGFFNYHGNKPWILYFPLAGVLETV